MELKLVYDKSLFEKTMNDLHIEYGDSVYNEKRMKEEFASLINKDILLTCLYDNEELVGHISYRKINEGDTACSVVSVFIYEEFRRKGYGKVMMKLFDEHVKNLNLSKIFLGARRGREPFYYSCGYEGEALLQANKQEATKQDLEKILLDSNLSYERYVFRNEEIHQFYFDAKSALGNEKLLSLVDSSSNKTNLVIVFSKDI